MAYISGGGGLLRDWLGPELSPSLSCLLFVGFLSPFVYAGAKMVDRINFVLMGGLIVSYLAFVALGLPSVKFSALKATDWNSSLIALPVIFTSFSYQGIIPSLTAYLKRDARQVRIAIISGTSIAFLIYLLWEFLILGIVPFEGEFGLKQAMELEQTAVAPLRHHVESNSIPILGQAFAFFAIATSFLGVTLGLFDFLADGLSLPKKGIRRLFLGLLTFAPPTVIALFKPHLFISALIYAGGIGCALLLGFLPTLMVWIARYGKQGHHGGPTQLSGGK
ncbi:MAG: aromatic amino acid transport family protein, partial [Chlamydiota bacterium]